MGRQVAWAALMLALLAVLSTRAAGQPGCTAALISLAPCLPFLQNRAPAPSRTCCTRFANVVQNNSQCLCAVAEGAPLPLGIKVNQTRSAELPNACNVTAPPASACNATATPPASPPPRSVSPPPAHAPAQPPVSPSPASTTAPSSISPPVPAAAPPAGNGTKAAPAPNPSSAPKNGIMPLFLFAVACAPAIVGFL